MTTKRTSGSSYEVAPCLPIVKGASLNGGNPKLSVICACKKTATSAAEARGTLQNRWIAAKSE